jgi:hypothetical protein
MITLTAPQGKAYERNGFYFGRVVYVATAQEESTFTVVDEVKEINENEIDMDLQEIKELRKMQFADMQKEIALLLTTAEKAVGKDNPTLVYITNMCQTRRAETLQAIEGLQTKEQALEFQIRESDAKPLKDALNNLILS